MTAARAPRAGSPPVSSTTTRARLLESDLRLLERARRKSTPSTPRLAHGGLYRSAGEAADDAAGRAAGAPRSRCWRRSATSAAFATPTPWPVIWGWFPARGNRPNHCYHGPITKQGRCGTRWMLIQSAQAVRTHPGPLGHFFRRLKQRKPYNVAVLAVAHKLALRPAPAREERTLPLRPAEGHRDQTAKAARGGDQGRSGDARRRKEVSSQTPGQEPHDRALAEVCAKGCPQLPRPAGEPHGVTELKLDSFVDSLQQMHVSPGAGNESRRWNSPRGRQVEPRIRPRRLIRVIRRQPRRDWSPAPPAMPTRPRSGPASGKPASPERPRFAAFPNDPGRLANVPPSARDAGGGALSPETDPAPKNDAPGPRRTNARGSLRPGRRPQTAVSR